jgi:hypothetical protein
VRHLRRYSAMSGLILGAIVARTVSTGNAQAWLTAMRDVSTMRFIVFRQASASLRDPGLDQVPAAAALTTVGFSGFFEDFAVTALIFAWTGREGTFVLAATCILIWSGSVSCSRLRGSGSAREGRRVRQHWLVGERHVALPPRMALF